MKKVIITLSIALIAIIAGGVIFAILLITKLNSKKVEIAESPIEVEVETEEPEPVEVEEPKQDFVAKMETDSSMHDFDSTIEYLMKAYSYEKYETISESDDNDGYGSDIKVWTVSFDDIYFYNIVNNRGEWSYTRCEDPSSIPEVNPIEETLGRYNQAVQDLLDEGYRYRETISVFTNDAKPLASPPFDVKIENADPVTIDLVNQVLNLIYFEATDVETKNDNNVISVTFEETGFRYVLMTRNALDSCEIYIIDPTGAPVPDTYFSIYK